MKNALNCNQKTRLYAIDRPYSICGIKAGSTLKLQICTLYVEIIYRHYSHWNEWLGDLSSQQELAGCKNVIKL